MNKAPAPTAAEVDDALRESDFDADAASRRLDVARHRLLVAARTAANTKATLAVAPWQWAYRTADERAQRDLLAAKTDAAALMDDIEESQWLATWAGLGRKRMSLVDSLKYRASLALKGYFR